MKNVQAKKENSKDSLFEELTDKYLPYWPLFIILLAIFLPLAAIYIHYSTPVYQITATILIADERKGADENSMLESLNLLSAKKIVENEVEVLHSRKLMNEVVKDLRLYAPVFEEGKVKPGSAYIASPVTIEVNDPDKLVESDAIYFTYDSLKNTVKIDSNVYTLNQFFSTPYGILKFTPNKRYSRPTERNLFFVLIQPKTVAADLLDKLDVSAASKLSSIVDLQFNDAIPVRGEDIVNTLLQKYHDAAIDYKNDLAKSTIDFVNTRLNVVTQELTAVEKKIQDYKSKKGIVDLSSQGKMYLESVNNTDQKVADINIQLDILNQVEKYVLAKDTAAGIVPSTLGVSDALLSKLLDRLYQAELDYDRLKKTTAENNPLLQSITNQIESIRPSILENIRNQRTSLLASLNNLNNINNSYNSVLQTIPEKERELIEVSRDQSVKNNVYSFLLQKREETALAYASNVTNSKIVEDADSSLFPVSPKRKFILLAAIVLAFGFTIAYVTLKELLSRKILYKREVENYTSNPIIGEISYFKNNSSDNLLSSAKNNHVIQNQFSQLRAALGLLNKTNTTKKILVTSSADGEGKSFISLNLASGISLSGKQVVLLDMDLQNSKLSRTHELLDNPGIAEYLERNIQQERIIQSTANKNLFLITSGKIKANTSELLLNGKLQELFLYLEKTFDFIIVDTSSINAHTDAYALSQFCDLTLYVIRHQYTSKADVKKIDENQKFKPLGNMYVIFNSIKPRGFLLNKKGYWKSLTKLYYNKKPKFKRQFQVNLKHVQSNLRQFQTNIIKRINKEKSKI